MDPTQIPVIGPGDLNSYTDLLKYGVIVLAWFVKRLDDDKKGMQARMAKYEVSSSERILLLEQKLAAVPTNTEVDIKLSRQVDKIDRKLDRIERFLLEKGEIKQ